jgi:hypothetical protein
MAKPFRKLEVELNGTRYVLNRAASEMLLERFEAFGDDCGDPCKRLREDLRKALSTETDEPVPANPFDGEEPEVTEETTFVFKIAAGAVKDVAKENAEADRDEKTPLCRFCDQPGKRAGERKDGLGRIVERYYVCRTKGCIADKNKVPQPSRIFSGGVA